MLHLPWFLATDRMSDTMQNARPEQTASAQHEGWHLLRVHNATACDLHAALLNPPQASLASLLHVDSRLLAESAVQLHEAALAAGSAKQQDRFVAASMKKPQKQPQVIEIEAVSGEPGPGSGTAAGIAGPSQWTHEHRPLSCAQVKPLACKQCGSIMTAHHDRPSIWDGIKFTCLNGIYAPCASPFRQEKEHKIGSQAYVIHSSRQ